MHTHTHTHTHTYTLRDRYLFNLHITHIRLCNVRVNGCACGLCSFSTWCFCNAQTRSQDARNASPNSAHFSSAATTVPIKATITSYSNIASYWSPCPISSASHLTKLINHSLMPLKSLQVFPMTLRIRVKPLLLLLLSSPSVVSNSLQPHGLQHARPPCPSPSP